MAFISEYVVKVASRCNLNCDYCYEYNSGDNSYLKQPRFISNKTFKLLCHRIYEHSQEHSLESINIGFHGGEVFLIGKSRLRELLQIITDELSSLDISLNFQTNGTLLTLEILEILDNSDIDISIGLSIDGHKLANDKHRLTTKGNSSFNETIEAINLIKNNYHHLLGGVLAVIDTENNPKEIFDFFIDQGIQNFDFLFPDAHWSKPPTNNTGVSYANWLIEIYKLWLNNDDKHITIPILESLVRKSLGGKSLNELFTHEDINLMTISTDGEYQGLDVLKTVGQEYYKTNMYVNTHSINDALKVSHLQYRFQGRDQLSEQCLKCTYSNICCGGYFPHRFSKSNKFKNPSVYCSDLFELCKYIDNDLTSKLLS